MKTVVITGRKMKDREQVAYTCRVGTDDYGNGTVYYLDHPELGCSKDYKHLDTAVVNFMADHAITVVDYFVNED